MKEEAEGYMKSTERHCSVALERDGCGMIKL